MSTTIRNTWPGGVRRAMTQADHEQWNADHYPGTKQICEVCSYPTERCEEDSIYVGDLGPLCKLCGSDAEAKAG